jgi:hypothetical protein
MTTIKGVSWLRPLFLDSSVHGSPHTNAAAAGSVPPLLLLLLLLL